MEDVLQIRVGCEFHGSASERSPAVFQLQPFSGEAHKILEESWNTEPDVARHEYFDSYGNRCQRLTVPQGDFSVRYDALVRMPATLDASDPAACELSPADLPDDVLIYTSPSRYCLSDEMAEIAIQLFGATPPGYGRVEEITAFVHNHLEYTMGASTSLTTALAAYERGAGVCRDFAHLAVTFCRALDIPARYTFGYLPDIDKKSLYPIDFHAWFEAYLGDRWWTFDPRNNERQRGRIVVGRGCDAVDVAMVTTYGNATLNELSVWSDLA